MKRHCPNIQCSSPSLGSKVVLFGSYYRPSDSRRIQRYRCMGCKGTFSSATFSSCFGQNKRRVNLPLERLLCSGVSMRRAGKILNIHQTTVSRKLLFLASMARLSQKKFLSSMTPVSCFQFDDLETFEHTKCKPLSITMAVTKEDRKILGFRVSQMAAKGLLAEISRKKYGKRRDFRAKGIHNLFSEIKEYVSENPVIGSDENPYYSRHIKKHFPKAIHKTYKGRRGCIVGQGELKKIGFDPLFSLNHTYAMARANMNRLFRRTWCTTKNPKRLADHLAIYVNYHNSILTA